MRTHDEFAALVASQFKSFEDTLNGIYWLAITHFSANRSDSLMFDYKRNLNQATNTFMDALSAIVGLHIAEAEAANGSADLTGVATASLGKIRNVVAQMANSVHSAVKRERLMTAVGKRAVGTSAKLENKVRDSIGRSYRAAYLVKTEARALAVKISLMAAVSQIGDSAWVTDMTGARLAKVTKADLLDERSDMRKRYFHPNSRYEVRSA